MIRRARIIGMALLAAWPVTSLAEKRSHGVFSVSQKPIDAGYACTFIIGFEPDGKRLVLSLTQDFEPLFVTFYIADVDRFRNSVVSLQIEGQELVRFKPGKPSREGNYILGLQIQDPIQRLQEQLESAGRPQLIEIVTRDTRMPVPPNGFQEAVEDYVTCRKGRWLQL